MRFKKINSVVIKKDNYSLNSIINTLSLIVLLLLTLCITDNIYGNIDFLSIPMSVRGLTLGSTADTDGDGLRNPAIPLMV